MLTFKNLQDNVLNFLDQQGDTSHGLDLVKLALQAAHEKRLMSQRWSFMLWPTPVTLTFVSGQRNYVLHPLATVMLSDFTNDTAQQPMKETPARSRFKLGVQDDRFHFEFVKDSPVRVQPATGVITVTGSVSITYVNTSGDVITETVTSSTTSASVVEVVDVTKLTDPASTTLVDIAGTNILTLAAGEMGRSYPRIRLFDDGRTETGYYRFYKKPSSLVLDNAIPNIPYPFSRILVYDALLELYTYNDDTPPAFWLQQQAILDLQMNQAYQEGEGEGSETRTIQEVDQYGG